MAKRANFPKIIKVLKEAKTGLNTDFRVGDQTKTRGKLADEIEEGKHPGYHVMKKDGKRIPRSNPDSSKNNNIEDD